MKNSIDLNFLMSCQDILNRNIDYSYSEPAEIICENIFFRLNDLIKSADNRPVLFESKLKNCCAFVDKNNNIFNVILTNKKLNKLIKEKGFILNEIEC